MNIVVINGTEVKGCTYQIKESFLSVLREGNTIKEFYLPRDLPYFCQGCKVCFLEDENLCPHAEYTMPIWKEILAADLLVFATPVYALRAPGQVKTLLDHLCCHWMVHRPDQAMFSKRAVILTNSIGAPNKWAQKDIATSLNWLGVSDVKTLGFGLVEDVFWAALSEGRRDKIQTKTINFAKKYLKPKAGRKGLKIRFYFGVCKMLQKGQLKKSPSPSADTQHWLDNGWL